MVVFDELMNFLNKREPQTITLEQWMARNEQIISLDALVKCFAVDSHCSLLDYLNPKDDIVWLFFHFYKV